MNFLKDDIRKLYWTCLRAAIFSAIVTSIYSFVDCIAVGQSEGSVGTAAIAVINPWFCIAIFFGILCGIGGSVLMSSARAGGDREQGDEYYTAAMLLLAAVTAVFWVVFLLFQEQLLIFFGADAETLPKAEEYISIVIPVTPLFVFPTALCAFVRNDGAPQRAMAAVIIGGCVNMFGDWFFVFPLGMGMRGAATATVIGYTVQTAIICSYLFQKRCTLRFRRPAHLLTDIRRILVTGIGAGILDLGTVVLGILINNQIMRYSGSAALAVYGTIGTIQLLFQSMFSGVGQAVQPLVSSNYAARQRERINTVMRLAMATVIILGIVFFAVCELFPLAITNLFMDATQEVLDIAPSVFRQFSPLFLFLGINVVAIYYLESVMRTRAAMVVSLARSMAVAGVLMVILPLFLGLTGVLIAMPLSELLVAAGTVIYMKKIQPRLYT